MNLFKLSWKYLTASKLSSLLSIILVALGVSLTSILFLLNKQFSDRLYNNIAGIDLVVSAKGSPLQMIMSSVYQIDNPTGIIPLTESFVVTKNPFVEKAIPLAMGDNYKGYRIIGTDSQYVAHYGAKIATGRAIQQDLEVLVGSRAAKKLNLNIGDTFYGSHGLIEDGGELHDAHQYKVVGVLAESQTVVDQLIVTNVASVWRMHEGHDHDHEGDHGHDHATHDDHEGHDHATQDEHEGHDHATHEGHDHATQDEHEGHDHDHGHGDDHATHDEHEGHDHATQDEHEGHNHAIHNEHEGHDHATHDEHEGHDHATHDEHEGHDHATHDENEGHDHATHDDHEGHDHATHEGHDHATHDEHEGHDHDHGHGDDHATHDEHEGHDHATHDDHEGHDHAAPLAPISSEGKSVSAYLVTYKKDGNGNASARAFVECSQIIDKYGKSMGYAKPSIQLQRLLEMTGVGIGFLKGLAFIIIFISALSMFISLFTSLKDRKYEIALMRVGGASRTKIFLMIVLEGLMLAAIGLVVGLTISHIGMQLMAATLEENYKYTFTGSLFLIQELWLIIGTLIVGFLAAVVPAIQAYLTDISTTLSSK